MNIGTIDLYDIQLPITLRSAEPASDDLLLRISEQHRTCKIERNNRGEITIMTPVGGIGGTHELFVASALLQWTEEQGTGIASGSSVGFNLPDTSCLSPDAAWLSLPRWNALTPSQQAGFPPLCPDFVVEVRSRTDSRRILDEKMLLWLDNGAQLAWLLDPTQGEAVLYQPAAPPLTLHYPDIIHGTGPVEGFELRATRLWTRFPEKRWQGVFYPHLPGSATDFAF